MAKAGQPPMDLGPFTGFGPDALSFFADLAMNQDRHWFAAHKATYETQVRRPLESLVESLAIAFAAHDIPLTGSAKASIFRIHRDVRFAKDKSPYKTNAGAVLSRDGTKAGKGILYIQVGGPEPSFMAAGFYTPDPADLAAIRQAIADGPDRWATTERALGRAGLTLSRGAPLARLPKGFEDFAGSPVADVLKFRNFITSRDIPADRLFKPTLVDDVVAFAEASRPLLDFGRNAIDRARSRSD
jgi:uncharacterized protein (TIGR02453 family)